MEVYNLAMVNHDSFTNDSHGATYLGDLRDFPQATEELFDVLNASCAPTALGVATRLGHPALGGVVEEIESRPAIEEILQSGEAGRRFRQAVGVAIRLRMDQLGWSTTGTKGVVRNARYFKKAERYAQ